MERWQWLRIQFANSIWRRALHLPARDEEYLSRSLEVVALDYYISCKFGTKENATSLLSVVGAFVFVMFMYNLIGFTVLLLFVLPTAYSYYRPSFTTRLRVT